MPGDAPEFGVAACLEALDVGLGKASQARCVEVLQADLETGDVLFDLLDKGQMPGQARQARVRLDLGRLEACRAGGDEGGVEDVVLGPAQPAWVSLAASARQPGMALANCQRSARPCNAMSSLALEVSIPAVAMLVCVIFFDPAL